MTVHYKSKLVDSMRQNDSHTLNGAVTHSTSLNNCIDLFFIAGASRRMNEEDIIHLWTRAYAEDPTIANKILFWSRDVRGGAGERRLFRIIWQHIVNSNHNSLDTYMQHIPHFGRWDDLWVSLEDNPVIVNKIVECIDPNRIWRLDNALLYKWLPRKGVFFNNIRKALKFTPKDLRKLIVENSNTIEQLMCNHEWSEITYSKVPSVAFARYRKAFTRNDEERFNLFIKDVEDGKESVNANAIFPHDVLRGDDAWEAKQIQWDALPNYLTATDKRILPVCDVSGSMHVNISGSVEAMDVCIALGMYISERNLGPFHNCFVTFSREPKMQVLKSTSLRDKYRELHDADWGMNTDLFKTFKVILDKAVQGNVSADEMPTTILIFSDMEFDECAEQPNFDAIKELYSQHDYVMPELVFWNLNGRKGNVPVKFDEHGTALVSGFSPALLKSILACKDMSPLNLMMDTLQQDRYRDII